MISIEQLTSMQRTWMVAQNYWLQMCQMHDNRLVKHQDVTNAHNEYLALKAEYDRAAFDYQQQAMNAKPAGGRQRA